MTPGRGARPEVLFNLQVSGHPMLFFIYHVYPFVDLFGPAAWVQAHAQYAGLDRGSGRYQSFVNTLTAGIRIGRDRGLDLGGWGRGRAGGAEAAVAARRRPPRRGRRWVDPVVPGGLANEFTPRPSRPHLSKTGSLPRWQVSRPHGRPISSSPGRRCGSASRGRSRRGRAAGSPFPDPELPTTCAATAGRGAVQTRGASAAAEIVQMLH